MKMNLAILVLIGLVSQSSAISLKSKGPDFPPAYHRPTANFCKPTGTWPNPDAKSSNCAVPLVARKPNTPSGGASVE